MYSMYTCIYIYIFISGHCITGMRNSVFKKSSIEKFSVYENPKRVLLKSLNKKACSCVTHRPFANELFTGEKGTYNP